MINFFIFFSLNVEAKIISLENYIHLVFKHSDKSKNYQDMLILSHMDRDAAEHVFAPVVSPDSNISFDKHTNSQKIGLILNKKNVYGGEFYSGIHTTRTDNDYAPSYYDSSFEIGYNQSLFKKFGKKYNTLQLFSSGENLHITKKKVEDLYAQLIIEAFRTYYQVILSRKKIKIYQESLNRAEHNFKAALAKYNAGLVPKIDVYRAKLQYLDSKEKLRYMKTIYRDSVENALNLMAQDITNLYYNFSDNIYIFNANFRKDKEAIERYINERYEWKSIISNEKIIERKIFIAKRDFLPDITMGMKLNFYNNDNNFRNSWKFNQNEWQINLMYNYSFDKFIQKQNLQRLKIQYNRLLRDKNAVRRNLKKEILRNFDNLDKAYYAVKIQEEKIKSAKKSLDIANIRYKKGLADNKDIVEAENELLNAQLDYYSTIIEYDITMLKLAKSINKLNISFLSHLIKTAKVIK